MDIILRSGEVYKDCKVTRVAPDGITVTHMTGIAKLPFPSLPAEYQEKYHYDPAKAETYAKAVEVQRAEQFKKDQQEVRRRKAERQKQEEAYDREKAGERAGKQDEAVRLQSLQDLAQNVRVKSATAPQCRALVGCTKDQVTAIMGRIPDSTFARGSTYIYNNLIDPESFRLTDIMVDFKGSVVDSVWW